MTMDKLKPAADPKHRGNQKKYHTGKPCIVAGCVNPAGTWWGPHWCQPHNAERLARITVSLDEIMQSFGKEKSS